MKLSLLISHATNVSPVFPSPSTTRRSPLQGFLVSGASLCEPKPWRDVWNYLSTLQVLMALFKLNGSSTKQECCWNLSVVFLLLVKWPSSWELHNKMTWIPISQQRSFPRLGVSNTLPHIPGEGRWPPLLKTITQVEREGRWGGYYTTITFL